MKPKNALMQTKYIIVFACIIVIIGFSIFLTQKVIFSHNRPELTANASIIDKSEKVNYGLPFRLRIPSINVDAAVEYVGLTSGGAMGVPKGPSGVAWFDFGPHPGEIGSAVIDGHSGWKNGIPASFDNLPNLKKGDKVYVEDDKGNTITFIVQGFSTLDPKADASDVFKSDDLKSHLNLITCEGAWDPVAKSHTNRLVVFTDKE